MSKNKKTILCIMAAVVAIVVGVIVYTLSLRAPFEDKEMKRVITLHASREGIIDEDDALKKEDVKEIKKLNIGYMGYYTTLTDITSCVNLEELYIGIPNLVRCSYYKDEVDYYDNKSKGCYGEGKDVLASSTEVKSDKIVDELGEVLKECNKIKILYVCDIEQKYQLNSLSFLEYGKNIEELWLDGQNVNDYSQVFACEKLKTLSLEGCAITSEHLKGISTLDKLTYLCLDDTGIENANNIIEIPNLNTLCIVGTPLAENEAEIARIYEAFPEIKIYK